jgi:hypothetical protein
MDLIRQVKTVMDYDKTSEYCYGFDKTSEDCYGFDKTSEDFLN